MFIVLLFSVPSKEINRILTVEFRLLNHTLIDINIFMPLYMTLCACVHVVSQLRGMLFQTAGALRRVWAAVWFVACTTGGRVRETALPRLGPSLSHYLRGSAHAETHTHTQTCSPDNKCAFVLHWPLPPPPLPLLLLQVLG